MSLRPLQLSSKAAVSSCKLRRAREACSAAGQRFIAATRRDGPLPRGVAAPRVPWGRPPGGEASDTPAAPGRAPAGTSGLRAAGEG